MLARERFDEAAAAAIEFEEILGKGNYFLEIQEHGLEAQDRIRKPLVELSKRTGVPLVATNDAHYLMPEDARAHDVLLCIGSGKTVNDTNRLRYRQPKLLCSLARRDVADLWRRVTGGSDPHRGDCRAMRSEAAGEHQPSSKLSDSGTTRGCLPMTTSRRWSGKASNAGARRFGIDRCRGTS